SRAAGFTARLRICRAITMVWASRSSPRPAACCPITRPAIRMSAAKSCARCSRRREKQEDRPMSKIARNPIAVPKDVNVEIKGQTVKAKGPKGELSVQAHDDIVVSLEAGEGGAKVIRLAMKNPGREARVKWGTSWSLIRNAIRGVQQGYSK